MQLDEEKGLSDICGQHSNIQGSKERVQRYLIRVKNKVQLAHVLEGAVERLDKDLWWDGRKTCSMRVLAEIVTASSTLKRKTPISQHET
jgi:hypothetical protein